jgi:hypothetical protein
MPKNLQSGHPRGVQLINAEHDSFSRLGHHLAVTSTGLLTPAALAFVSGNGGQPLVSVGICRVAELSDSSCQVTSSQTRS